MPTPSPTPQAITAIATHFDMLMDVSEQERIGATADRAEHMRVMRVLAEYADLKTRAETAERELEEARMDASMANFVLQELCEETGTLSPRDLRDKYCALRAQLTTPGLSKTRLREENRLLRKRAEAAEALLRTYYGEAARAEGALNQRLVEAHNGLATLLIPLVSASVVDEATHPLKQLVADTLRSTPPDEQWAERAAEDVCRIVYEYNYAASRSEISELAAIILSHAPKATPHGTEGEGK